MCPSNLARVSLTLPNEFLQITLFLGFERHLILFLRHSFVSFRYEPSYSYFTPYLYCGRL